MVSHLWPRSRGSLASEGSGLLLLLLACFIQVVCLFITVIGVVIIYVSVCVCVSPRDLDSAGGGPLGTDVLSLHRVG